MKNQNWSLSIQLFNKCIEIQSTENEKIHLDSLRFIEYFPHRELGICLYHIGAYIDAEKQLRISIQQVPSDRAYEYLAIISNLKQTEAYKKEVIKNNSVSEKYIGRDDSNINEALSQPHKFVAYFGMAIPFGDFADSHDIGISLGFINILPAKSAKTVFELGLNYKNINGKSVSAGGFGEIIFEDLNIFFFNRPKIYW